MLIGKKSAKQICKLITFPLQLLKTSMRQTILFLSFFVCFLHVNAQNYANYYRLINTGEEVFTETRDASCYAYFDSAFVSYDPFLKDPYIAAQIALSLKDTAKFYSYLEICFEHGMPYTAINSSPMIRKIRSPQSKRTIDSLFQVTSIRPDINPYQYDKLCMMCYQSDSLKVYLGGHETGFCENEDITRQYLLDTFLMHGLFPNERLFGISTDERQETFYAKFNRENPYQEWPIYNQAQHDPVDFDLYLKCPYNIILHSQCFYWKHKELFHQAMLNGYIHPKEIAIIEERSIIHQGKRGESDYSCLPLEHRILYNVYGFNPMKSEQIYTNSSEGLRKVEENRAQIHLQKYSVDMKKLALERSEGFRFFFDFANR